ncbi:hypothetical protein A3Q56_01245 [Intoshia linei]|uniref:Kinesin motor domain-containing protein n=1 Tax=Intoshia linei TaxID=1819745 RepID=A0A177B9Z4_9BILA|nr:hypothetical protein A3Q56_01245 [Intoshia linei]
MENQLISYVKINDTCQDDKIVKIDKGNKILILNEPKNPDIARYYKIDKYQKKSMINSEMSKTFVFESIFKENTQNLGKFFIFGDFRMKEINEKIVNTILIKSLNEKENINAFSIGYKGTGKTRTMVGNNNDLKNLGLIPKFIISLYNEITNVSNNTDNYFSIRFSAIQIYKNKVNDLLKRNSLSTMINNAKIDNIFSMPREYPAANIQVATKILDHALNAAQENSINDDNDKFLGKYCFGNQFIFSIYIYQYSNNGQSNADMAKNYTKTTIRFFDLQLKSDNSTHISTMTRMQHMLNMLSRNISKTTKSLNSTIPNEYYGLLNQAVSESMSDENVNINLNKRTDNIIISHISANEEDYAETCQILTFVSKLKYQLNKNMRNMKMSCYDGTPLKLKHNSNEKNHKRCRMRMGITSQSADQTISEGTIGYSDRKNKLYEMEKENLIVVQNYTRNINKTFELNQYRNPLFTKEKLNNYQIPLSLKINPKFLNIEERNIKKRLNLDTSRRLSIMHQNDRSNFNYLLNLTPTRINPQSSKLSHIDKKETWIDGPINGEILKFPKRKINSTFTNSSKSDILSSHFNYSLKSNKNLTQSSNSTQIISLSKDLSPEMSYLSIKSSKVKQNSKKVRYSQKYDNTEAYKFLKPKRKHKNALNIIKNYKRRLSSLVMPTWVSDAFNKRKNSGDDRIIVT